MVRADGVDRAIIGEVNKSHLVVYKQMEHVRIATNKKNSITAKFHKKRYNNNLLLETCKATNLFEFIGAI